MVLKEIISDLVSISEPLVQVLSAITYLLVVLPLALWFVVYDLCSLPFRRPPVEATNVCITGASSGIGKALAVEFARPGVQLGLFGRNEERLKATAEECIAHGAKCTTFCVDITNQEELEKALHTFDDTHPIDLFIANAGQAGATLDNRDEKEEQHWKRLIDVNLVATIASVMTVYRRMSTRRHGQIAITSSIMGYYGPSSLCFYNTSKAALNSFARDLRNIAREHNVHVTAVTPGLTESQITQGQTTMAFRLARNNAKDLAEVVRTGLKRDAPAVGWPRSHVLLSYVATATPPRIRPVITRFFDCSYKMAAGKEIGKFSC